MSSVVVEPVATPAQLYFPFAEVERSVASPPMRKAAMREAAARESAYGMPAAVACQASACDEPRPADASSAMRVSRPTQAQTTRSGRLGKPVRLGSVMLELLRSYGISEEEIAEGLQRYACTSALTACGQ
ncbi:MAG: hypothetical protein NXI32_08760 [bacterium]|nr:hypothetical protein [bacterium]